MKQRLLNKLMRLALFLLLTNATTLYAQESEDPSASVSTNASNYQNVNMDLFHGRHNITIPIYNFKSKNLSIPITLNYSPVDVISNKVFNPGWVGLGWNLTAGGVISRSINGAPDETGTSGNFFNNNDSTFNPIFHPEQTANHELGEDEFSFSFCGYSGTFIYYRGSWKIYSDINLKITPLIDFKSSGNDLIGFVMGTPDGNTYTFGGTNAVEYSVYSNYQNNIYQKNSTSWYLTQIESPEGDQINFKYETGNNNVANPILNNYCKITCSVSPYVSGYQLSAGDNAVSETSEDDKSRYDVFPVYLSEISSPSSSVKIQFNRSNSKVVTYPELPIGYQWDKLDNIILNTVDDKCFKRFDLSYIDNTGELLKLQSIQETGVLSDGTTSTLPAHQCSYIPNTSSVAPDVLNKIVYPTGGYSSFEFEQNSYSVYYDNRSNSVYFSNRVYSNGSNSGFEYSNDGFRLKSQTSKGSDNDVARITRYYYTNNFPTGNNLYASSGIKNRTIMTQRSDQVPYGGYTFTSNKNTNYDCAFPNELPNSTIKDPELGYSSVWVVCSKENESSNNSLEYINYRYINYISNDETEITYNNRNEVGKLTAIAKYDYTDNLLSQTTYEYEHGPQDNLMRYFVKPVTFKYYNGSIITTSTILGYNSNFSQFKLSRKTTENHGFLTRTIYKYNYNTNNLVETDVLEPTPNYSAISTDTEYDEDNDNLWNTTTTTYRYLDEFYDDGGDRYDHYDFYQRHKVTNLPVETVVKRNGKVVSAKLTKYSTLRITPPYYSNSEFFIVRPLGTYTLNISSPISDFKQTDYNWTIEDSRYKLQTSYDQYDNQYGNLLEVHNNGGAHTAYYYDPVYQYLLIESKNCTYSGLSSQIDNNHLDISKSTDQLMLRKLLPGSQVTSYTYDPKFGVNSMTAPNGLSGYTEFDALGRIKTLKDNKKNIIQSKEYNLIIQ